MTKSAFRALALAGAAAAIGALSVAPAPPALAQPYRANCAGSYDAAYYCNPGNVPWGSSGWSWGWGAGWGWGSDRR